MERRERRKDGGTERGRVYRRDVGREGRRER